jgi:hypothetical protein
LISDVYPKEVETQNHNNHWHKPPGEIHQYIYPKTARLPATQHFHFEYLAPLRSLNLLLGEEAMNNVGGNYNWLTYIKVSKDTDIKVVE